MAATIRLKAPFPWFGGKRKVASMVWERLGDPDNYIEPFAGSAAMLLCRSSVPKVETLNDLDCYVANFWRATVADPEAVAAHADWPVNEADLHARHRWLVLSEPSAEFRKKMRADPDHFDAKIAGWWVWGLCCWIGGGWCKTDQLDRHQNSVPDISGAKGVNGNAILPEKMPGAAGSVAGVNAGGLPHRRPVIAHLESEFGHGIHGRPQLADAFARGRGVNGNDAAEACADRRQWLVEWFGRLRDRLRTVRVCCGDWLRICDSESVTTRLGTTAIFFDPPYSTEAGRDMDLYAVESGDVAHAVRAYCLERGGNKMYRIVLCGYAGEGHEELERHGWEVVAWKAVGGYGSRGKKGGKKNENSSRERIWFSPHCRRPAATLFDFVGGVSPSDLPCATCATTLTWTTSWETWPSGPWGG